MRLKTGRPGVLSGSTQKYASRSNWQRVPAGGGGDARLDVARVDRLERLRVDAVEPVGAFRQILGVLGREQVIVEARSALTACRAETQWIVPRTFRPSGA